jgi:acyl-CoA thioesterase-1
MQSDMKLSWLRVQLTRRHCIALAAAFAGAGSQSPALAVTSTTTILVLGDSLSAEYGLRRGTGWVALLTDKLKANKSTAQVVNASISGDTTSGGRSRLGRLLQRHQPDLLIIELGANDALRGLSVDQTQVNLQAMTQAAQKQGAKVLLIGMQVPPNYGRDYAQRFSNIFGKVAHAQGAGLVPFMLKGVADGPDSQAFFQADRIHPIEAAHPIILANIWSELRKLIQ